MASQGPTDGAYLVEMCEDGLGAAVAQFAGETGALGGEEGAAQLHALYSGGKFGEFARMLAAQLPEIVAYEEEGDTAAVLAVMASSVRVAPAEQQEGLVADLCKQLTADTSAEGNAEARLRGLLKVFAFSTLPAAKLASLVVALGYAQATAQREAVLPVVGSLSALEKAWGASAAEMRPLRLAAADLLWPVGEPAAACGAEALEQLERYLSSFGEGDAALAEAAPAASRAVAGLVACEGVYGSDLLGLPAVRQLSGSTDDSRGGAVELLDIFLTGRYGDYAALIKKRPGLLAALGLEAEAAGRRMRLQSLAALAAAAPDATMSYADIAADLQVEDGEVEEWVVEAIGADVFVASIDQLAAKVMASKVARRTFGGDDWKVLRERLGAWRASIAEVAEHVARYSTAAAKATATRVTAKAETA